MITKRSLALWFLGALALFLGAAALVPTIVHADPVAVPAVAGVDWTFWIAVVAAVLGGLSAVLHVVAPRTTNTIDDELRDDVDKLLAFMRGQSPQNANPASRDPQAGISVVGCLIALALGGLVALAIACTAAQVRQGTSAGVIGALDCEAAHLDARVLADARALADAEIQRLITGTAPDDLAGLRAKLASDLAPIKSDLGRCAVAGAVAAVGAATAPATPGEAVSALSAGPPPVRAAFALAAREIGWPVVRVAGGTTL